MDLLREKNLERYILISHKPVCRPPRGHNFLHHIPGKKKWINSSSGKKANEKITEISGFPEKITKKPLNIDSGSRITNKGKPKRAAVNDVIAIHLPISGTLLYSYFTDLLSDDTLSKHHPAGQRYLQNQRFRIVINTRTGSAIMFNKTRLFSANTEFSIMNGLSHTCIP